ncbi:MAG: hypothetical protein EXR52_04240 [Dehalococcoidia bacterium]|nr:hypothetical protein [Dehalococcoidia bacterium]
MRRLVLVSATCLGLFAGCSGAGNALDAATPAPGERPRSGGVLSLLLSASGDPPTYDLHRESVAAAIDVGGPVYENLLRFEPLAPTTISPDLATRWEAATDGLGYTFSLRPGVRFHSGSVFTATDAVFSLQRVGSPPGAMASPRKAGLEAVQAYQAIDAHTVRLQLSRPSPSLLANLAQGWMVMYERAWVEAGGNERPTTEMNGTGPFRPKAHQRGASFEVERSADYWLPGLPYLDGIKLLVVPDFSTRIAALRTGQVHVGRVFATDGDTLGQALGDKVTVSRTPAQSFGSLTMNARRAPFDDPRVREAVNLAIDRQANVQLLAQGAGEPGGFMTPGGAWALPPAEVAKLPGYGTDKAADIAVARRLLNEAGYGSSFDTTITTRTGQTFETLAVVMADQLKKVGISATIVPMETTRAFDAAQRGDFGLLTWGHEFALDDPDAVYGEFYGCGAGRNYFGLCLPEVDALMQQQSRETNPDQRRRMVLDLERSAVKAGIKLITHWNHRVDVWWNQVHNYRPHAAPFNNARYREVWLSQ